MRKEFFERCRKNPAYSMRAFALFLGLNQSFLSKILRGQRRITPRMAELVVLRLGLDSRLLQTREQMLGQKAAVFAEMPEDHFEFLGRWEHFAILELAKTKSFQPEPAQIARRLGLHVEEVRDAIERLQRLRYIQIDGDKWTLLSPDNSWTDTRRSSEARRRMQRSWAEKSLQAIENVPFANREHGSLTVAIDKNRLPEFKEKLKQVRAELAEFFQPEAEGASDAELSDVYQLTFGFFPISK